VRQDGEEAGLPWPGAAGAWLGVVGWEWLLLCGAQRFPGPRAA